MKISALEAIQELQAVWPWFLIEDMIISDEYYWTPTKSEVSTFLQSKYLDEYQYTAEMMDCEDFSLIIRAFIVQERYKDMMDHGWTEEERLPWAFGQAGLTKYQGITSNHTQNLCITSDSGVFLIESQTNEFFFAIDSNDTPYYIIL